LSFLVGLAMGIAVGALAGSRSLPGLKRDFEQLLGNVVPEAQVATERTGVGLAVRLRQAQDVYEKTREATRQRLQRELESARKSRP
jgi:hypothetical protein